MKTIILLVAWIRNFVPLHNGRTYDLGQDDNENALTCEKLITRQRRKIYLNQFMIIITVIKLRRMTCAWHATCM